MLGTRRGSRPARLLVLALLSFGLPMAGQAPAIAGPPPSPGPGGLSGTVTDLSGTPLANICVDAQAIQGSGFAASSTGVDGTYALGATAGTYQVSFLDCSSPPVHLTQTYNRRMPGYPPVPVVVTDVMTKGINARLLPAASIAGQAADRTGHGLASVCVQAMQNGPKASATTAADGSYLMSGMEPGTYTVEFRDCGQRGLAAAWWSTTGPADPGTPIALGLGQQKTGINLDMVPGGSISGSIHVPSQPTNVANQCVGVYDLSNPLAGGNASTDATGAYRIDNLFSGTTYHVHFYPCHGVGPALDDEWYKSTSARTATAVLVRPGRVTAHINGTLRTPGSITGTVRTAAGKAVAGECIRVYQSPAALVDMFGRPVLGGSTVTAANGSYTVAGVFRGSYNLDFADCAGGGWADQWFSGQPDAATATAVVVVDGATTKAVNVVLGNGGSVSGTLTGPGGAPQSAACVGALDQAGALIGPETSTDAAGAFRLGGVAPGSYSIRFRDCASDVPTLLPVTLPSVTVTAGHDTGGTNATLPAGGVITGTVTDTATGTLEGPVCVGVFDSHGMTVTTAYGVFSMQTYQVVGLATGVYTVEFSGCPSASSSSIGYATQWWQNRSAASSATPISVTAGATTTGIDAAMVFSP